VLFEGSEEGREPGLGILPGYIRRFRPEPGITIPHMGWNQLDLCQADHPLWRSLNASSWVYFVHSYYAVPTDQTAVAATVTHGTQTVTAAIGRDHLMALPRGSTSSGNTNFSWGWSVGAIQARIPSFNRMFFV
jgi:glutamine amidotransferase